MSTLKGVVKPIIADRPVLDQPPKLVNTNKASYVLARGAITQRGMMMANRPAKWRISTVPSIRGSFTANTVLKRIEKVMAAIIKSVPYQACHT